MKKIVPVILALTLLGCGSNNPPETNQETEPTQVEVVTLSIEEQAIFDYLKTIANDPQSIELVDIKKVKSQTVAQCFKEYNEYFATDEEKKLLSSKREIFAEDSTEVGFCYSVNFRGKNSLNALVLNNLFVLLDKNQKVLTHGDGVLVLNGLQMKSILFEQ